MTILRGINPLLTPDLLHALAAMGHGDRITLVDANYPGEAGARRLVRLPGIPITEVLSAILTLLPIDDFIPEPTMVMQVVGDPGQVPPVVAEMTSILAAHGAGPPAGIERFAFYRAAAESFALVQTGERRFYGNIILTKGVIPP